MVIYGDKAMVGISIDRRQLSRPLKNDTQSPNLLQGLLKYDYSNIYSHTINIYIYSNFAITVDIRCRLTLQIT